MNFSEIFKVKPGAKISLKTVDPDNVLDLTKKQAHKIRKKNAGHIQNLQYKLYTENRQSLLIILQAMDAAGKDGAIKSITKAMNPKNCSVHAFKRPSEIELAHDFLWRVHLVTPKHGETAVFNRSHYEDVLIARTHKLVPQKVWMERYELINAFERLLAQNNTRIIKVFLHISKAEQLKRFLKRLENPAKNWKISKDDYSERKLWDAYQTAFEDVFHKCSPAAAPWYIIPANNKWFRNAAVSQIIRETLEDMHLKPPKPEVDLNEIRLLAEAEKQLACKEQEFCDF